MKKFFKVAALIIGFLILLLTGLFISIAVSSGNRIEELTDNYGKPIKNSISEKNWAEIGGIRQGYFIRTENPDNPVLLFLHGGPGFPETPDAMSSVPDTRLEKLFTVCYWEQRGAGISFNPAIDSLSMTADQLVEDTREMTVILQKRFGKQKIFLMGHSWGTMLGIKTIQKYPELYHAYIGVGQMSDQRESERLAYDYMLHHAIEINDENTISALKKYDRYAIDFPPLDYHMTIRNKTLNKYGVGALHENSSELSVLKSHVYFEGYTLKEKFNLYKGLMFTVKYLGGASDENLFETALSLDVPIYFIQGKYDYQVSYVLAKRYLDAIVAPKKAFFTFENSAHCPYIEEPDEFINTVQSVLFFNFDLP
jgi:pimeloyl-ACP methyl ester carboxylesterase